MDEYVQGIQGQRNDDMIAVSFHNSIVILSYFVIGNELCAIASSQNTRIVK